MIPTRLFVCTNCDWKGQQRLDDANLCPDCESATIRYEESDKSWRQQASGPEMCSLCGHLPRIIDSLCPDCFWLAVVKPRLELRTSLLEAQSENEASLKAALERVAPTGRQADGTYRSVMHKCVCGHIEESWLSLHLHMQEAGVGHSYILHGDPISPAKRSVARGSTALPDVWVDMTEEELQ